MAGLLLKLRIRPAQLWFLWENYLKIRISKTQWIRIFSRYPKDDENLLASNLPNTWSIIETTCADELT